MEGTAQVEHTNLNTESLIRYECVRLSLWVTKNAFWESHTQRHDYAQKGAPFCVFTRVSVPVMLNIDASRDVLKTC